LSPTESFIQDLVFAII